jgi:hypothetical protein
MLHLSSLFLLSQKSAIPAVTVHAGGGLVLCNSTVDAIAVTHLFSSYGLCIAGIFEQERMKLFV